MEGLNPSIIYLIYCKNFCKCHNPASLSTKINEKRTFWSIREIFYVPDKNLKHGNFLLCFNFCLYFCINESGICLKLFKEEKKYITSNGFIFESHLGMWLCTSKMIWIKEEEPHILMTRLDVSQQYLSF
jgi:hypothetical protein